MKFGIHTGGLLFAALLTVLASWGATENVPQKYLTIQIFEQDLEKPKFYIRSPLAVLYIANNFLPEHIRKDLEENDIDIHQIIESIEANDLSGRIVDMTNLEKRMRIVIDIENKTQLDESLMNVQE